VPGTMINANSEVAAMSATLQQPLRVPQVHHWTRSEYERMTEVGLFAPDARLELLDGAIIDMSPQGPLHVTATQLVAEALRQRLPTGYLVRVQAPIALDHRSEPEPDICVVPGAPRDYAKSHPTRALLVIEVSDSTLEYDRTAKAAAYARNGIPEYWILNVRDRVLEVLTRPGPGGYASKTMVPAQGHISSEALPILALAVAELLP
jgi:Uma2 family endonuclease